MQISKPFDRKETFVKMAEDEGIMFLRNVGIYWQVHTA
jgi:hypothetical protein